MVPSRIRRLAKILPAALVIAAILLAGDEGAGAAVRPRVIAEAPATSNDLRAPRAQNSPMLAVDPTDPRFVALAHRLDAPDFNCALQLSGDGGNGWVPARPVPKLPEGAEKCYGPEIAFDRDGTLYYLFVGLAGRGNNPVGVFLTSSDDRGQSFSAPRRLLGPGNYQVRMALDPTMGEDGRLHLVWLEASADAPLGGLPEPPNPILTAHSDDGGETFSKPIQISDPARELAVAPGVALGPDHAVHVIYYDLQDDRRDYQGLEGPTWPGTWSLVTTSSMDGGRRFGPGVVVDDGLVPPERVILIFTMPPAALAADRAGGLFAAWYDARNGDWDVFLGRSTDGGRSWEGPLRVNNDERGNGRHQYLPQLATAPDGRIDAVFLDRRNDPENLRNHTYYTSSTDGGGSFGPNVRLSSADSQSRSGQRYLVPSAEGLVEFGGRLALASAPSGALAAWPDTRNSGAPTYQDVFAAQVALPTARDSGSAAAPAAASSRDWPGTDLLVPALLAFGVACLAALTTKVRWRERRTAGGR